MMGLFSFIFNCTGCTHQENKEDEVKFSTYTQQQRKEYIINHLEDKYGQSYNVSEVKQKQETAIKNEDFYFATATAENGEVLSIWVSKNGAITDSHFLIDLKDEITSIFSTILEKEYSNMYVDVYTEMRGVPQQSWESQDDMETMLSSEETYSYVRVFVQDINELNQEKVDDIANNLGFCNGELLIYICENIQDVDIENFDATSYIYASKIRKGE